MAKLGPQAVRLGERQLPTFKPATFLARHASRHGVGCRAGWGPGAAPCDSQLEANGPGQDTRGPALILQEHRRQWTNSPLFYSIHCRRFILPVYSNSQSKTLPPGQMGNSAIVKV